jgi:hypothetical protein
VVGRPPSLDVELGEQRAPERIGGEDVEALVADVGGGAVNRVEGPLDLRPDALLGLAPAPGCGGGLGAAGKVEEVGAFGVVELECAGQRFEHAVGGAADVSAFESRVVGDAYAGQDGDLLTAQSRNTATAVRRQPHLLGGDPGAAGGEELADLLLCLHETQRRPDSPRLGDPAGTPPNRVSHSAGFAACLRAVTDKETHND